MYSNEWVINFSFTNQSLCVCEWFRRFRTGRPIYLIWIYGILKLKCSKIVIQICLHSWWLKIQWCRVWWNFYFYWIGRAYLFPKKCCENINFSVWVRYWSSNCSVRHFFRMIGHRGARFQFILGNPGPFLCGCEPFVGLQLCPHVLSYLCVHNFTRTVMFASATICSDKIIWFMHFEMDSLHLYTKILLFRFNRF